MLIEIWRVEQRRPVQALLLGRDDADLTTALAGAVLDDSVDLGKQRVVATAAYVETGMDLGAALTDQDRTGANHLAVECLGAEPLGR